MRRALLTRQGAIGAMAGAAVLLGTVLVLAALLATGCGGSGDDATAGSGSGGSKLRAAPDFQATTLAGEDVSLGLYRGRPLVLAFMASW